MPTDLGPIQTLRISGGRSYILPARQLGSVRKAGIVLVMFGLVVTGFMCTWMGMPTYEGIKMLREGEWFGWLLIGFGLLGSPGLAIGLGMIGLGIAIIFNLLRAEVELLDDRIVSIERVGPFKWRRSRKLDQIKRFELVRALEGKSNRKRRQSRGISEMGEILSKEPGARLLAIEVSGESIKPMKMAGGFPVEILRPLVMDLADRMGESERAKLFDSGRGGVEVIDFQPDSEADEQTRIEAEEKTMRVQPAGSKVVVERYDEGLTLTVPPMGVWKGSSGLFTFGLIWTLFCGGIFTTIIIISALGGGDTNINGTGEWVFFGLFALLFLGVGAGVLAAGIHMGRRKVVIDVIAGTLLLTSSSPIRKRQLEWSVDLLDDVDMGPSGMEVNGRDVMCLRVTPKKSHDNPSKWLSGRDDEELQWLAATIRHELGMASG